MGNQLLNYRISEETAIETGRDNWKLVQGEKKGEIATIFYVDKNLMRSYDSSVRDMKYFRLQEEAKNLVQLNCPGYFLAVKEGPSESNGCLAFSTSPCLPLLSYLASSPDLEEFDVFNGLLDIANSLRKLHEKRFAHLSVCPQNIYVCVKNKTWKLGGTGFLRKTDGDGKIVFDGSQPLVFDEKHFTVENSSPVLSPLLCYSPLELPCEQSPVGISADVFSFAVSVIDILHYFYYIHQKNKNQKFTPFLMKSVFDASFFDESIHLHQNFFSQQNFQQHNKKKIGFIKNLLLRDALVSCLTGDACERPSLESLVSTFRTPAHQILELSYSQRLPLQVISSSLPPLLPDFSLQALLYRLLPWHIETFRALSFGLEREDEKGEITIGGEKVEEVPKRERGEEKRGDEKREEESRAEERKGEERRGEVRRGEEGEKRDRDKRRRERRERIDAKIMKDLEEIALSGNDTKEEFQNIKIRGEIRDMVRGRRDEEGERERERLLTSFLALCHQIIKRNPHIFIKKKIFCVVEKFMSPRFAKLYYIKIFDFMPSLLPVLQDSTIQQVVFDYLMHIFDMNEERGEVYCLRTLRTVLREFDEKKTKEALVRTFDFLMRENKIVMVPGEKSANLHEETLLTLRAFAPVLEKEFLMQFFIKNIENYIFDEKIKKKIDGNILLSLLCDCSLSLSPVEIVRFLSPLIFFLPSLPISLNMEMHQKTILHHLEQINEWRQKNLHVSPLVAPRLPILSNACRVSSSPPCLPLAHKLPSSSPRASNSSPSPISPLSFLSPPSPLLCFDDKTPPEGDGGNFDEVQREKNRFDPFSYFDELMEDSPAPVLDETVIPTSAVSLPANFTTSHVTTNGNTANFMGEKERSGLSNVGEYFFFDVTPGSSPKFYEFQN